MTLFQLVAPVVRELFPAEDAELVQSVTAAMRVGLQAAFNTCYNPRFEREDEPRLLLDDVYLVSIPLTEALDVPLVVKRLLNPLLGGKVSYRDSTRINFEVHRQLFPLLEAVPPVALYVRKNLNIGAGTHLYLLSYGIQLPRLKDLLGGSHWARIELMGGYNHSAEKLYDTVGKLRVAHSKPGNVFYTDHFEEEDQDTVTAHHRLKKLEALLPDAAE